VRVYLDTNIAIYIVEGTHTLCESALSRVDALKAQGGEMVASHLVRMEAKVKPLAQGNTPVLERYAAFFGASDLTIADIAAEAFDRAAQIRADWRFDAIDALHLAVAVEAGCDVFLTNDGHLKGFPDLRVETLGTEAAALDEGS